MEKMQTQELISAMADGQLQGEAFARGVEAAAADPVAREAWHTYHLIGDVLRSGEFAAGTVPTVFLSRLQSRLQQEQRRAGPAGSRPAVAAAAQPAPHRIAANDGSFRWKLVAGFASLAAMAAIGWTDRGRRREQARTGAAGERPGRHGAGGRRARRHDPRPAPGRVAGGAPPARRRFGAADAGWIPAQRHVRRTHPLRRPATHGIHRLAQTASSPAGLSPPSGLWACWAWPWRRRRSPRPCSRARRRMASMPSAASASG